MRSIGYKGEKIAVDFLLSHGYKIIAKNYTRRGGEIDIIAEEQLPDKKVLAFVEVKYYKEKPLRQPWEAVDARKQKRIRQTAARYVQENKLNDSYARFDIVLITSSSASTVQNIELIKDAFRD